VKHPKPSAIRALRDRHALTQEAFGLLVHSAARTVEDWEGGRRAMHPGLWELVQLKLKDKPRRKAGA